MATLTQQLSTLRPQLSRNSTVRCARRAPAVTAVASDEAGNGPSPSGRGTLPFAVPGRAGAAAAVSALALTTSLLSCDPALAIHMEPANALSLPTWAIHVSSVTEWAVAMGLVWRYAEVTNRPVWKGLTWGMLPALGSAMCACTWHFFYNSPDLEFLVALQAALTVISNFTCWLAAYRIYKSSSPEQA